MLESLFQLRQNNTTVRTEILAGLTTFLTMAYIIFVNPAILADAGMDRGAVFVATCLAAAIGSLIMGLYANYPIALAPGMGVNAFFTYGIVIGMGHSWQTALGAVFISGVLFFGLSLFKVREWIINSIPVSLKLSIAAGIGLFLAIIALQSAGIVVAHPVTLVTLGDLGRPEALIAVAAFFALVALDYRQIPGAIVIAILGATVLGVLLGLEPVPGVFDRPPSLAPTFLQMDIGAALDLALVSVIFTLLFIDLFDTAGTLIGVAQRAGFLDERGRLPRIGKALLADSSATMVGAALGTSTTTSYIESLSGIKAGGRTGLTAVVVAILFLASLVLAPLALSIPSYATAPALLFVGCLMLQGLTDIDWGDATEFVPATVTAIAMPLTFSISTGIGFGFVAYAAIKILSGRPREAGPAVIAIALLFIVKFSFL